MAGSLHAHDGFEKLWRTLGEIELNCVDPSARHLTQAQVRALLERCVPVALTGEGLRTEIETVLFATLARVEPVAGQAKAPRRVDENLDSAPNRAEAAHTQNARLRIMAVAAQLQTDAQNDDAAPQHEGCAGWSFFVIERPTAPSLDGAPASKIIELCLYQE